MELRKYLYLVIKDTINLVKNNILLLIVSYFILLFSRRFLVSGQIITIIQIFLCMNIIVKLDNSSMFKVKANKILLVLLLWHIFLTVRIIPEFANIILIPIILRDINFDDARLIFKEMLKKNIKKILCVYFASISVRFVILLIALSLHDIKFTEPLPINIFEIIQRTNIIYLLIFFTIIQQVIYYSMYKILEKDI